MKDIELRKRFNHLIDELIFKEKTAIRIEPYLERLKFGMDELEENSKEYALGSLRERQDNSAATE